MKCIDASGTSIRFCLLRILSLLGRVIVISTEGLLGALCGILAVGFLIQCWSTVNWSELQSIIFPVLGDVCTKTAIITGAPAGIACVAFLSRSRNRRPSMVNYRLTREFLKELEQGDYNWLES
jgi:hypothetical protein